MQRGFHRIGVALIAVGFVGGSTASAEITLEQAILTHLQDVLITHAGDGSNRLFIPELNGYLRVLAPGNRFVTTFMDITGRVAYGGEAGLWALAFHPRFAVNGRFFVYYASRTSAGRQLSEFKVSASNPNQGDPNSEIPILNLSAFNAPGHNGGTLAFGPDGYLYLTTGDGGSMLDNNTFNNVQNNTLLYGKVLRIDVDHPDGSRPYSIPPDNPYAGAIPGADEIYALGFRNPWRCSFDRGGDHLLYCGDVGRDASEEINVIANGGNYGWPVYEGTSCTNLKPQLCTPANYVMPSIEYGHSGGRCAVIGGYVYRGFRGTVPVGTYLYGDSCTGEIFQIPPGANGGAPQVLLDSPNGFVSFGEDESGELYVGVYRIVPSPAPPACTYSTSPSSQSYNSAGGTGSFNLTAGDTCGWIAASHAAWITLTSPGAGGGNATISYTVEKNTGPARLGTIQMGGRVFAVRQSGAVSPVAWRSVRSHSGVGPLGLALNATRTGNGSSGPTVEPRIGGIQRIEVDFNSPITLANEADISVVGRTTTDGVMGPTLAYVPTSLTLADADTLAVSFAPDSLPDATCYTITIGAELLAQGLTGDLDISVRALAGDTTMDGAINIGDTLDTKTRATAGTLASASPQHDVNRTGGAVNIGDCLQVKGRVTSPTTQALCP